MARCQIGLAKIGPHIEYQPCQNLLRVVCPFVTVQHWQCFPTEFVRRGNGNGPCFSIYLWEIVNVRKALPYSRWQWGNWLYFGEGRSLFSLLLSNLTKFYQRIFPTFRKLTCMWLYFSRVAPVPFKFDSEEDDLSISQTLQETGSDRR